jgi:hypothetical protein
MERCRDRHVVTCSATGLHNCARVTCCLVDVFERPSRYGYLSRARHHHEVTVEALLQDEPSPGNVGPKRHDDDCAPPILRSQTTQLSCFAFRRRRIWDKAVHGELGVWGGAIFSQPRVIRPARVRNHQVGSPALPAQLKAERVSAVVRPAKDKYCVGMAQLIDLWTHIHRQSGDYRGGEQQADGHREASGDTPAQAVIGRQCAPLICGQQRCPHSWRSQSSSRLHTVIGALKRGALSTGPHTSEICHS